MRDYKMDGIFNDDVALMFIGLAFCTGYILKEAYDYNDKNIEEKKEEEN